MNTAAAEIKLIFAGPTGVGKTTAIAAISDTAPVNTDVTATDEVAEMKATTTVAMDYSSMTLEDGTKVGLYGTPGQGRFDFMWKILAQGALGLVLLVDDSNSDAVTETKAYLDGFDELIRNTAVVVGVNKAQVAGDLSQYHALLDERGIIAPIITVDVREKEDVLMLIDMLTAALEFA